MRPTRFPRPIKWVFSAGGYGNDNRRARRLERRARDRETTEEIADAGPAEASCPCPCHTTPDHCAICDNDYADLCGAP